MSDTLTAKLTFTDILAVGAERASYLRDLLATAEERLDLAEGPGDAWKYAEGLGQAIAALEPALERALQRHRCVRESLPSPPTNRPPAFGSVAGSMRYAAHLDGSHAGVGTGIPAVFRKPTSSWLKGKLGSGSVSLRGPRMTLLLRHATEDLTPRFGDPPDEQHARDEADRACHET